MTYAEFVSPCLSIKSGLLKEEQLSFLCSDCDFSIWVWTDCVKSEKNVTKALQAYEIQEITIWFGKQCFFFLQIYIFKKYSLVVVWASKLRILYNGSYSMVSCSMWNAVCRRQKFPSSSQLESSFISRHAVCKKRVRLLCALLIYCFHYTI